MKRCTYKLVTEVGSVKLVSVLISLLTTSLC